MGAEWRHRRRRRPPPPSMWHILLVMAAAIGGTTSAICPSRCRCNEDALRVSCASAALAVVPIQLNPEVRHIDLASNKIASVHFMLAFYDKLLTLDLSGNRIQSLGGGEFEAQRALRTLNLSRNEVDTLSKDALRGLRALAVLDLSGNRLEEITAHAFRDLHSLEVLQLDGNQLVHLEAGLLKPATMLRELRLDANQLLDVPTAALADAYGLQRLSLAHNLIATVGEGALPPLAELQVLRMESNVIADVHAGALSGLVALEQLDLSDNNFTSVPTASLAKLANLTQLRFSDNVITTVPPVAFRGLFQLRTLHLNRLDFLAHVDARAFVDNINLEAVWMDDNIGVPSLPHRLFYGNPRLRIISIRNNRIAALDASHFPLDQLQRLQVGGNPLQCNCSLLWLWRLAQEQRQRVARNSSDVDVGVNADELGIDVEDIVCAGPEPLAGALLMDTTESQVGCSLGWLAVGAGIALTFILLAIAVGVLYCGPMRKRMLKNAELPPIEPVACANGQGLTTHTYDHTYNHYEEPCVDKYIIGPPMIHDYRALPPWDQCAKNCGDVYNKHFDKNSIKAAPPPRPHIVYV